MRRYIILILWGFVFSVSTSFAQDIIVQTNGNEVQTKITEVSTDEVKYKKHSNLSGPSYVMQASDIFMIKYENKDKDLFEKDPQTGKITIRNIVAEKASTKPEQKAIRKKAIPQEVPDETKTVSTAPDPIPVPKPVLDESSQPTDAKTQFQLGSMYEKGEGVPQSNQKAAEWYSKAAEQGYSDAQYNLSLLCLDAKGITVTTKEDFTMRDGTWVNAEGIPIGKATALYWLRKAAGQGHVAAKAKLKEIEAPNRPSSQNASQQTITSQTESTSKVQDKTAETLHFKGKKIPVSIGEIEIEEKEGKESLNIGINGDLDVDVSNMYLDISSPHILNKAFTALNQMVRMKLIYGDQTMSHNRTSSSINLSKNSLEITKISFTFDTNLIPDKIIVFNDESSITFDGKTKSILKQNK